MANPKSTPAYLNNNPLNMRPLPNGEQWQGQVGVSTYAQTGSFCRFITAAKGVRAAVINMRSIVRLGRHTLSQMINTWAPVGPDQNGVVVNNYLNHVATRAGLSVDYDLSWLLLPNPTDVQAGELARIVRGMNEFEAGGETVSIEDINAGIADALSLKPGYIRQDDGNIVRTDVSQSSIVKAANKGVTGTVTTVAAGVVVPTVTAVAGAPPLTVAILVGAFLLTGAAVAIYFLIRAKQSRMGANNAGVA